MKQGLARLVELEQAHNKELHAKLIRAHANMYSTEYDWVNKAYRTATRMELEAEFLRTGHLRSLDK